MQRLPAKPIATLFIQKNNCHHLYEMRKSFIFFPVQNKNQISLVFLCFILLFSAPCISQKRGIFKDPNFIITPATPISLERELRVFNNGSSNALYRITIGADVPYNKKPGRLIYNMETGHVFLVLQKIDMTTNDTIHKVFGFYPYKLGLSIFFKRELRSTIKDNSHREHDIELSKIITAEQFEDVMRLAVQYSKRNYHLNNFNCYDYALTIFNSVARPDTLPFIYRKFGFFGKGGSPCTIYKYLKQQQTIPVWGPYIRAGNLIAPVSTTYKEQVTGSKD
jgi:hypothetical protein